MAALPQARQTLKRSASGVPVLSTVAEEMAVISSISSAACAIMGLAPTASARLAQSLAETILLTQWTRGRRARISSSREKSGIDNQLP